MNDRSGATCQWLLVGNYGAHNTGDEAMLAGLITGLSSSALQLCVVSKTGQRPGWSTSPNVTWTTPQLLNVARHLYVAQGLILGGGTHFHDDYQPVRLLRHWKYLSQIVGLCMVAKALRKRVLWLGVGMGPLHSRVTRSLARAGLLACDRVTVRDGGSLDEVKRLLPGAPVAAAFDLAALLPPPSVERGERAPRLGVSVIGLANARQGSAALSWTYWDHVASGLSLVLDAHPQLTVVLITIRGGSREDDAAVTERVYRRLVQTHATRVEVVPYDPSPYRMFEHVAACDYMLGARYHASMLAFLAGVPQIVLAYHQKCADFCDQIGLPAAARLDVSGTPGPEAVRDRVIALINRPGDFAPELSATEAHAAAQASVDAIVTLHNPNTSGAPCVVS